MPPPFIISLGGSLVAPDGPDTAFIAAFRELILKRAARGERYIIVVGGGKTARRYMDAGRELGINAQEELDSVGIYATRLNAELLRAAFGARSHGEIITDPRALKDAAAPVAVCAGWKPGHSTDFDAVLMAEQSGARKIVNLSNIDFVYDKDPRRFPDAKKIETMSWTMFRREVLPKEWRSGLNAPFDPVAAERAEKLGLELAVMNGKPLENLETYLEGKPFKGTVIR